jgi:hypothetical protein
MLTGHWLACYCASYYCSRDCACSHVVDCCTHSSLVAYSELVKFNSPVYTDKFLAATPNSTLHPSATGAESLIRWMGVPLFFNSSSSVPDGVYIAGDLVNGKCACFC